MRLLDFRLFFAWMLALTVTFFTLGFLSNSYSTGIEIILLSIPVHLGTAAFLYLLLGRIERTQRADLTIALVLFIVLLAFVVFIIQMVVRFPSLFDAGFFLLEDSQLPTFAIGVLLALPALYRGIPFARSRRLKQARVLRFVESNLPGLTLAVFFLALYLILASIFSQPHFDVDDIFFDSDGLLWYRRFVTPDYQDYYWRAVHPFVLLIVRPLVALISLFLKGDRLSAAFVLVASSGAACVFLAWYFVKHTVGSPLFALLIAALLGSSAAHLVFSSLIETYILLAAVTMTFLVLLLRDRPLTTLVLTGLVSFGITITNFVQTAILFIFVRRDFKAWIKYGVIVAALTVPLSILNNAVYPDSQPFFFLPSSFNAEADNTFAPSLPRGLAVARVMAVHSVVAPDPLILEEEIPFLKVWIFKADPLQLGEYKTWTGSALALAWCGLLILGGFLFARDFRISDNRYPLAFILILLFNFVLHLRYGKDVFLYSTNWTYAIILFLALAWKRISDKKWFQITLLVFIALLLLDNSRLIHTMLSTSALHIK